MQQVKKYIKDNFITIILFAIMLFGAGLMIYPSFSDYWNSFHQSRAIAGYSEAVADMSDEEYDKILKAARKYNKKLSKRGNIWNLSEDELKEYNSVLDISGTGIMGYIEIDKIKCSLPIYHGTGDSVLQIAIGHIQGSSLPIGGESTHSVLSGHRGLPSAKLFTDLDKMENGDTFVIRVLDETMTYEVDQILIVEPDDLSALGIEEGKDLCTLVTCTPYGINTHRLLVRGHRVENALDASTIRITADGIQIEPVIVAPMVAAPMLFILLVLVLIDARNNRNHKKKGKKTDENENALEKD